nr:Chain C, C-terminal peptide of Vangl2 [Homo sapiens]6XA8_D Chain D, C-terminal peptide of Vangl2 [Homo sapiens]
LQSETSV